MKWLKQLKNIFKNKFISNSENVEIVTQVTPIDGKLVIARPLTWNCRPEDPYPLKLITKDGGVLDVDTLRYIDSNVGNEYIDGIYITVIYDIYHISIDNDVTDNIVAIFSTGDRAYGVEILVYN